MTRILFTTNPMPSHLRPTAPVVRELTRAGRDVAWYTAPAFRDLVEGTGARFVPSRVERDVDAALRSGATRRGLSRLNQVVFETFLAPVPAYMADLGPHVDAIDPDVIVTDPSFRAGWFLAEARDVPRVALSIGPLNLSGADVAPFGMGLHPASSPLGRLRNRVLHWTVHHVTSRGLHREAERIRARAGLEPLDGFFIDWASLVADRYLQATIPELEYPRRDLQPSVQFVGAILEERLDDWTPPSWWPDLDAARESERAVVFVTQGMIATDPASLLLPAITALADEPVLVVVSTSGRDPDEVLPLDRRPANLRMTEFVPYVDVLARTDLVVSNGGYGGVQTALAHGVPLVVSGTTEDKKEITARLAWSGAGLSLATDAPDPADLRAAIRTVLTDPSYRDRARRLRDAYARYDAASGAAAAILEVAALRQRSRP
jgi:MGT family glycosyltransferase